MISDNQLYTLAIFLGTSAMLLIVLYHYLEVNAEDNVPPQKASGRIEPKQNAKN
jgi:oligosaccharyl transferase complex subunit OST4